jgi:BNR repeat-containing family member/PKD domain/Concanavalin A-like lectin/glucanases superfamily
VALIAVAAPAPASAAPPQQPAGDGAWCWFADPRGVHHEGAKKATYVGWVGEDGDIKVASFDHRTGIRTTAVLKSRFQVDDHANPALMVRPDGRIQVFYSRHNGQAMYYRLTRSPEDVTSWEPEAQLPSNTSGGYGFTYPNPIRLSAESRTYLFWRGGNNNPTFSTQQDGQTAWAPARNLVSNPGQRPYVKYASRGTDTIGFAFTDGHPNESTASNIYFAYIKAGGIHKADGTRIGTLGTPITPAQADKVFDNANKSWVHDMAFDSQGRPVIVFAEFVAPGDHRYRYAKWVGDRWVTAEITRAGGSIAVDGSQPYYSAGITLDHEDPRTVYLSRDVGGIFEVETWTTPDDGATWTRSEVTAGSSASNFRPISPRGLIPFSGAMSVVWMRGIYTNYISYKTSIAAVSANGGSKAPIADAEWSPHTGVAPQTVSFDGRRSSDPDGSVASWSWDFGDGTTGSGAVVNKTYAQGGRFFPKLTVTDNSGSKDVYVGEVLIDPRSAPAVSTGGATGVGTTSATLNGSINPKNQTTHYAFQYWRTGSSATWTPTRTLPAGNSNQAVSAAIAGLTPGATYQHRLVASNGTGVTWGVIRTFTASATAPSRYRDTVLATSGRTGYWRLGEATGTTAADEAGTSPGTYLGGFLLDQVGAIVGDSNSSVRFDGVGGEMSAGGPALAASGSLEGWFDWRGGVALMRDASSAGGTGWILAFDSGGSLLYRLGGKSFNTGRTTASVQNGWHHFVVTKDGGNVAFYLDGQLVHSGTGAGSVAPTMPWHVMKNGGYAQFAAGGADEVAVYNVPLSAATVQQHYNVGRGL